MVHVLREALQTDIRTLTFRDNSYCDESFVAKCIKDNFSGWYTEDLLSRQLDLILRTCRVGVSSKVLDAACGHGRHSELLSQRGHTVVGIDISPTLVAHLNSKNITGTTFRTQAFNQIDYQEAFNLAIVLGNSLGLIPRGELPEAIRRLVASLVKGGWLFIEMDNRIHFVRHCAGRNSWAFHANRWLTLSQSYYDDQNRLEKTIDTSIDLTDGTVGQFRATKSLYDPGELCAYFTDAGLQIRKTFGDWTEDEITEASPSILIAAERAF